MEFIVLSFRSSTQWNKELQNIVIEGLCKYIVFIAFPWISLSLLQLTSRSSFVFQFMLLHFLQNGKKFLNIGKKIPGIVLFILPMRKAYSKSWNGHAVCMKLPSFGTLHYFLVFLLHFVEGIHTGGWSAGHAEMKSCTTAHLFIYLLAP